ncbi:MAG: hypothetical protein K2H41_15375 [Acetatifactor sp.]|nr:hypothetical protein [Acetatifactor sp.]MDE6701790.1 hypothetical protein [Acetatifactor sp.]MDE7270544.1 hypothetical protein [Acetatifactor sp.]
MAFGTIEFTTISRAQDYTTIKQNEDNKGLVEQTNLGQQAQRTEEHRAKSVVSGDQTEWKNKKHDAREKSSNEYSGDGGRQRKKEEQTDRVVVKGRGSFDMKI